MSENIQPSETSQEEAIENNSSAMSEENTEENQIAALQKANKELEDKYIRLYADFDNFRRQKAKETLELRQTAAKDIITSLLDVIDDCERAEKEIKSRETTDSVLDGTLLVFNKLKNILSQKGLKAMNSIHEEFDVEKHEAITEIEVQDELKGKVVDEVMKGYYLNDKIIRFAKVVVGK